MIKIDVIEIEGLLWENEYDWTVVAQSRERTLSGSLVVEEQTRVKGRLIYLTGREGYTWIDRTTLKALDALAQLADHQFVFTDDSGTEHDVMFTRSGEDSPIKTSLVKDCITQDDSALYNLHSINMITV